MVNGEIVYRVGRNNPVTLQEFLALLLNGEHGGEVCWYDYDAKKVPFALDVDVYAPEAAYFSPAGEKWYTRPSQVNWGAHGAETPEGARIYGDLILEAARVAATVNKGIKLVTHEEAHDAYRAHRKEVTAQHAEHDFQNVAEFTDCDECNDIKRARDAAQRAANEANAQEFQKRANKLYRAGANLDWNLGTYEQRNEARKFSYCEKHRVRNGYGKHVMNQNGNCAACGKHIDYLVNGFTRLVAGLVRQEAQS